MYFYLVGTGADIQEDLAKIPSGHNQFPPPQPFTLIRNYSLFLYLFIYIRKITRHPSIFDLYL